MDITSHNIMNGLRKWIMEDDWNTLRLHLSHNDLDGHSCHIMARLATNMLNPASKSSLTFWTSSAGKENIEKTILRYINKMETVPKDPKKAYVKGKKKIFILMTDLGNFNPNFINSLIADGHLINYIYIDHHQVGDDTDKVELTGNTEEFQMAANCYYVDDSVCATKSIGDAVRAIIMQKRTAATLSNQESKNLKEMLHQVEIFSKRIDSFDRGLWGKWVGLPAGEIDGAVAEQLFFKSFESAERYKYVSLMANYFHTYMIEKDIPEEEKPFWCVDMERFRSRRYTAIKYQLKKLNDELNDCKRLLRPLTVKFNIPDSFPGKDNLKIYEIVTGENQHMNSFTLVSRELLEEHPEIDILALVYTVHGTVDMRTTRDDLNLFEIAFYNGGGGHPKAAGFPIEKPET